MEEQPKGNQQQKEGLEAKEYLMEDLQEEKKVLLRREEIKTMRKDISQLRETEAQREKERLVSLKVPKKQDTVSPLIREEEARRREEEKKAKEEKKLKEIERQRELKRAQEMERAEAIKRAEEVEARRMEEARRAEELKMEEEMRKNLETEKAREIEAAKEKEAERMREIEAAKAAESAEKEKLTEEEIKSEELRKAEEAKRLEEEKAIEEAKKLEEEKRAEEARKREEEREAREMEITREIERADEVRKAEEIERAKEARIVEKMRMEEEERKARAMGRVEEFEEEPVTQEPELSQEFDSFKPEPNQTLSFFKKVFIRLAIVTIIVFLEIAAGFLYWYLVIAPQEIEETPIKIEKIIIPPSLVSVQSVITLDASSSEAIPSLLSQFLGKDSATSGLARILIENRAEKKLFNLQDFFAAFSISTPTGFLDKLNNDFTLVARLDNDSNRLGFVAEIKENEKENLEDMLTSWEPTMEKDFENFFSSLGEKGSSSYPYFRQTSYGQISFHYISFPQHNYGICWSTFNNYFLWMSSGEGMMRIIDALSE